MSPLLTLLTIFFLAALSSAAPPANMSAAAAAAAAAGVDRLFGPTGPASPPTPLWLDCDPGHDDAVALLLAAHTPAVDLIGVSTVHGNAPLGRTSENALRLLEALGRRDVPVYAGAARPFCRAPAHAAEIHGETGIDGTTLLPAAVAHTQPASAIEAMYEAIMRTPAGTAALVGTGAFTNIALLLAAHPDVAAHLGRLSLMGGAVGGLFTDAPLGRRQEAAARLVPGAGARLADVLGRGFSPAAAIGRLPEPAELPTGQLVYLLRKHGLVDESAGPVSDEVLAVYVDQQRTRFGNYLPMAEFNVLIDPESAASIFRNAVLAAKTTLIPLDVTHQVLAGPAVLGRLLRGDAAGLAGPAPPSPLRQMFVDLLLFFADTYLNLYGEIGGPPVHDPLAVLAAVWPGAFTDGSDGSGEGERFTVRVRTESDPPDQLGRIELVAAAEGVRVPRGVDAAAFWEVVERALERAVAVSPLSGK